MKQNTAFFTFKLHKLRRETKQMIKTHKITASDLFVSKMVGLLIHDLKTQQNDRLFSIIKAQTVTSLPKSFTTLLYVFFLWNLYGNMARSVFLKKKHSIKNKSTSNGQEATALQIPINKFFKDNLNQLKSQKSGQMSRPLLQQTTRSTKEEKTQTEVPKNAAIVTVAFLSYQVNNKSSYKMTPARLIKTAFALQQITLNTVTK